MHEGDELKLPVIGLDDVIFGNCAWSAKTVKGNLSQKRVRLISGRNSPSYSFNEGVINKNADPNLIGNEVRTLRIFEVETKCYNAEFYDWFWNKRGNFRQLH